ncbi:hypothetical protein F5Y19DRAFT_475070 [Xylariaceae sp. FL1651]|nr:hypothetical protein F5Y19DRAFT_475070 [Xylariaceae sp. FL1651]
MKTVLIANSYLLLCMVDALNIFERQAGVCTWSLAPNDCICMNSVNGAISASKVVNNRLCIEVITLRRNGFNKHRYRIVPDPTATCCTDMGLKAANLKCSVSEDTRQTFKDCCKWLAIEHVVGHCR